MTTGSVLNKITKQYIPNVVIETYVPNPRNNNTDWIINPNVTNVIGLPTSQWVIVLDTNGNFIRVRPMTAEELDTDPALVAQARTAQLALLQTAAINADNAGVVSSALGTPHLYASDQSARIHLIGAFLATMPTPGYPAGSSIPFLCIDVATGQPDFDVHTFLQLRQVVNDGVNFLLNNLKILTTKQQLVNQATRVSEIQAITWTSTP